MSAIYNLVLNRRHSSVFAIADFEIAGSSPMIATSPRILSKHFLDLQEQSKHLERVIEDMLVAAREMDIIKLILCGATTRSVLEDARARLTSVHPNSIVI